MAIIYYPVSSSTYIRRVSGGQMVEQYIDVAPDQIIVLSGSTPGNAVDFITASYALTYQNLVTSSMIADTSSFAITASFALNAGLGTTSPYVAIATSSTNWITASFINAEQYVSVVSSALYSFTSSNPPSAGQVSSVIVYIANASLATSSLSFPSDWIFMGSVPSYLTSSKDAVLSLRNYGGIKTVAAFTSQY